MGKEGESEKRGKKKKKSHRKYTQQLESTITNNSDQDQQRGLLDKTFQAFVLLYQNTGKAVAPTPAAPAQHQTTTTTTTTTTHKMSAYSAPHRLSQEAVSHPPVSEDLGGKSSLNHYSVYKLGRHCPFVPCLKSLGKACVTVPDTF